MKLVAVVLAVGIWATGTAVQAQMSSSTTVAVKGKAIPDAMAYHMWFNHFAFVLNGEATTPGLTKAELAKTGLNQVDQSIVKGAVMTWEQNFKQLINEYNAKVTAGTATYTDSVNVLRARDALALSTYNSIKSQLSADGAMQFYNFIQKEKSNMGADRVTP